MNSTPGLFFLQSDWSLSRRLTQLVGHKHSKRMKRRSSSGSTKKQRHRATVYTVTRTKRWRNVMPALHKSVNGFKRFPSRRLSKSNAENLLCHHRSISRYSISLRLFRAFPSILSEACDRPLFPLKIDRLRIIGGADKRTSGIVRAITNIN